jgi:hypothetical protein
MANNGPLSSSNVTAGYMDLATAWNLEAEYLYGSTPLSSNYGNPCSISYFVLQITRCSWFTQIPVTLRTSNGVAGFGTEFSVSISRLGEYMLNSWIQVRLPSVTLLPTNKFGVNGRLRWTRNLMHNLIEDANITFNDQQVARIDNYILDNHKQYYIEMQKCRGYDIMIGDTIDLVGPHAPGVAINSKILQLPLPFWFAFDSGLALPTASLLFNDIKFNFKFRNVEDLLILEDFTRVGTEFRANIDFPTDIAIRPELSNVSTWATYALVSENERNRMADSSRDIIIEHYQSASRIAFNPVTQPNYSYEPKFTFAVKQLMFSVENTTWKSDHSNYTCASPFNNGTLINFEPAGATPPIETITLNYESTTRLSNMNWEYFSRMVPFLCNMGDVRDIGYGTYSYALNLQNKSPCGSTNYSKLGNVQVQPTGSANSIVAINGLGAPASGMDFPQSFKWILIARSYLVIRIDGGQLTFPYI